MDVIMYAVQQQERHSVGIPAGSEHGCRRCRLQDMHTPLGLMHVWWRRLHERYERHYNIYREPTEMLAGPVALKACFETYAGEPFSRTGYHRPPPRLPAAAAAAAAARCLL